MHESTFILLLLLALAAAQTLVLIGGNLKSNNSPVWSNMVAASGGVGKARIGVISIAPNTTTEINSVIDSFLKLYKAKSAIHIRLTPENVDTHQIVTEIQQQSGIFLVEGSVDVQSDQEHVLREVTSLERKSFIDVLRPSGRDSLAMSAIKDVVTNGGMVAGESAILGDDVAILSGDSLSALVLGTKYEEMLSKPMPLEFIGQGLGLLSGYIFDSHLSEKGREIRMIRALLERRDLTEAGNSRGLGVDENTALFIHNPFSKPRGKVVTADFSTSGVFVVDVSKIPRSQVKTASYQDIPFSFFTVNDTIDLQTNDIITFAPWKLSIAGEEWFPDAIPSSDILSQLAPSELRKTARRLIDCKEISVTSFSSSSFSPHVRVTLNRTLAVGFGADIPDDPNKTYVPSFYNMLISANIVDQLN